MRARAPSKFQRRLVQALAKAYPGRFFRVSDLPRSPPVSKSRARRYSLKLGLPQDELFRLIPPPPEEMVPPPPAPRPHRNALDDRKFANVTAPVEMLVDALASDLEALGQHDSAVRLRFDWYRALDGLMFTNIALRKGFVRPERGTERGTAKPKRKKT